MPVFPSAETTVFMIYVPEILLKSVNSPVNSPCVFVCVFTESVPDLINTSASEIG